MIEPKFVERIAGELALPPEQVTAAVQLFDRGATVPFIARYRKDAVGNLSEALLERIEERNAYFIALTNRRNAAIDNLAKQEKLTDELRAKLDACFDQVSLDDLYLPYKKQRRTKASIALDQGLEPLAAFLWAQMPVGVPVEEFAVSFVNSEKSVSSPEEALLGAQNILAEHISLDPAARGLLRDHIREEGRLTTSATKNAHEQKNRFDAFYHFSEPLKSVPNHKLLAILRGVRTGVLRMDLVINDEEMMSRLTAQYVKEPGSLFEPFLRAAVEDAYKRLLRPAGENEVVEMARERADEEIIQSLRESVEQALMAPAAGAIPVMGVDPGPRTGCKIAVVDEHGAYLESVTLNLNEPEANLEEATQVLLGMIEKHGVRGIAISNGLGAREVARFVNETLKKASNKRIFFMFVNHPGAALYAASKTAQQEFPDLEPGFRSAVSLARKLQDPMAELLKLEARNIITGQFVHDVNPRRLRDLFSKTFVSCVNRVGADINQAPAEVLRYICGFQMGTAQNLIEFRKKNGGIRSRAQLTEVSGIGDKTFEQCAGFLRVIGGENPLDAMNIHPEAYGVVEKIAEKTGLPVNRLIGNREVLSKVNPAEYATETIGPLVVNDILDDLLKVRRDPRPEFRVPNFLDGVYDIQDLEEGVEVEGVVTHVTDYGAFVDIGVRQDGLIHLSELANRFVRNPRDVVQIGDLVRVKVTKVDKDSRRVSLSRKALLNQPPPRRPRPRPETAEGAPAPAPDAAEGEAARRRPPRREGETREDQGAPRRRERREEGDGRDRRAAAPSRDRGDRERSDFSGARRSDKRDRRPGARPGKAAVVVHGESGSLANTQLADQLAALREKLGG